MLFVLINTLLTISLHYQNCKLFTSLIMNPWINHMHQKGPGSLDPKTCTQSLLFQILHITIQCSNLSSHGIHKCGRIGHLSLLKPNHGSKASEDIPMEEHSLQLHYILLLVTLHCPQMCNSYYLVLHHLHFLLYPKFHNNIKIQTLLDPHCCWLNLYQTIITDHPSLFIMLKYKWPQLM